MIGCICIRGFPAWALARAYDQAGPVVVVARDQVAACTPQATSAGILPGMQAERVGPLLPSARIYLRDRATEQAVWEEVLYALNQLTPFLEGAREGLAFLRIEEEASLRALATRLHVPAGLGTSRATAHLAAVRAATGNMIAVGPRGLSAFLNAFPVESLQALGFLPELTERLLLFGYRTLGAVAGLARHHLESQFGTEGGRLYQCVHPSEEPPIPAWQPPPIVSSTIDLEGDAPEGFDPVLRHLVDVALPRLGAFQPQRIRLVARFRGEPSERATTRILPEPVPEAARLFRAARLLLSRTVPADREPLSLTLELGALRLPAHRQQSLFSSRPSVYDAVRAIHRKFPGAVLRAVLHPHALFPEDRTHYEPFPERAPALRKK